ncbi:hypothetical protein FVE85_5859 [Porphyridium purpureum]|uniref:Uncharacterized protein n=1 Tax=Porphyridium purpureum TaxID=35688 RepID=A0A5J4Z5K3_PORPP|nr:hypothetical protein FVE85_5859 [Porphyridium purpureum]|eukprot:POR2533..scf295_1
MAAALLLLLCCAVLLRDVTGAALGALESPSSPVVNARWDAVQDGSGDAAVGTDYFFIPSVPHDFLLTEIMSMAATVAVVSAVARARPVLVLPDAMHEHIMGTFFDGTMMLHYFQGDIVSNREFQEGLAASVMREVLYEAMCFPKGAAAEYYRSNLAGTGSVSDCTNSSMVMSWITPKQDYKPFGTDCSMISASQYVHAHSPNRLVFFDWMFKYSFCAERHLGTVREFLGKMQPSQMFTGAAAAVMAKVLELANAPEQMKHGRSRVESGDSLKFVFVALRQFVLPSTPASSTREQQDRVHRYAKSVMTKLRRSDAIDAAIFLSPRAGRYADTSPDLEALVRLLVEELPHVYTCHSVFMCPRDLLPSNIHASPVYSLFSVGNASTEAAAEGAQLTSRTRPRYDLSQLNVLVSPDGLLALDLALGNAADLFVGNVHSALDRLVAALRLSNQKPVQLSHGFRDMKGLHFHGHAE